MIKNNYWQSVFARRISRRSLLRAGLASAAAAAVYGIGCGDGGERAGTPTPQATGASPTPAATATAGAEFPPPPPYSKSFPEVTKLLETYHWSRLPDRLNPQPVQAGNGGVAVIASLAIPVGFNPAKGAAQHGSLSIWFGLTHNNLLAIDYGARAEDLNGLRGSTRDGLAETFEQPDETTMVFRLKPGIKFHNIAPVNGRALTTDDIKASLEFYAKDAPFVKGIYGDIDRVETPDASTVRIVMKFPSAPLVTEMHNTLGSILPREQIEAGGDTLEKRLIGTGPFMLKKWEPGGPVMTFERNPDYFNKDEQGNRLPYLDGIAFIPFAEAATTEAAFRSKQVDYFKPVQLDQALNIHRSGNVVLEVIPNSPIVVLRLAMSPRNPLFQDVRVRRAISLALDRDGFIDTTMGGAATARGSIPFYEMGFFWDPPFEEMGKWHTYNPELAKQLLAEAGVETPVQMGLFFPTVASGTAGFGGPPHVIAAQNDLKQIGVEVQLRPLDNAANSAEYFGKQWTDMSAQTGYPFALDPDAQASHMVTNHPNNFIGISDTRLDDLYQKQRTTLDRAERQQLLKQMWDIDFDMIYTGASMGQAFGNSVWHSYLHDIADAIIYWVNGALAVQLARAWLDNTAPRRSLDQF